MTRYEWAMLMHETYAKQNDCEQSEYYYKMAQFFKKADKAIQAKHTMYDIREKLNLL